MKTRFYLHFIVVCWKHAGILRGARVGVGGPGWLLHGFNFTPFAHLSINLILSELKWYEFILLIHTVTFVNKNNTHVLNLKCTHAVIINTTQPHPQNFITIFLQNFVSKSLVLFFHKIFIRPFLGRLNFLSLLGRTWLNGRVFKTWVEGLLLPHSKKEERNTEGFLII